MFLLSVRKQNVLSEEKKNVEAADRGCYKVLVSLHRLITWGFYTVRYTVGTQRGNPLLQTGVRWLINN